MTGVQHLQDDPPNVQARRSSQAARLIVQMSEEAYRLTHLAIDAYAGATSPSRPHATWMIA